MIRYVTTQHVTRSIGFLLNNICLIIDLTHHDVLKPTQISYPWNVIAISDRLIWVTVLAENTATESIVVKCVV